MHAPLPLVPFETYMLADDRVSHPMTFTIRLKFRGSFNRSAFEHAVSEALARHPLLAARVAKSGRRKQVWTWSDAPAAWLDIAEESVPLRSPGTERIDLTRDCGLRIWVRESEGRVEIRLQFHHSATDGVGAYRFIEDLLCLYHNGVVAVEERVALRPLDAELLKRRGQFGLSWPKLLLRLPMELWGIVIGFAMFFLRRPVEISTAGLVDPGPDGDTDDGLTLLDLPAKTLSKTQLGRMKDAGKQDGATLNDLLIRDLCLAVHKWNVSKQACKRWKPIRVMIPTSLRVEGDELMPAANVVAMVFVDRRPTWYPDSRWLLRSIAWELKFIKSLRLGLAFIRGTAIGSQIPGGLRFLTRTGRSYATCVISNMGRVLSDTPLKYEQGKLTAGEMQLEGVESAPPIRPRTKAALSIVSYAGRMTLILNYDRHAFTRATAEELFKTIVRQIEDVAGESIDEPAEQYASAT